MDCCEDPGQVVWMPGTGFSGQDETLACQETYGGSYYACGDQVWPNGWTEVWCCS